MKLTVFYDEPYWVGVVEVLKADKLMAGRHIFGPEPSLPVIWEFVLRELPALVEGLSCGVTYNVQSQRSVNPKRLARQAAKEMRSRGVNTASQEAMKLELEQAKKTHASQSKEKREAMAEYKREVARMKAKAKHRGK